MGVSTKAIIRKNVSLTEIKEALEKKYGEVEVRHAMDNYFFYIDFKEEVSRRHMSIFMNDYGLTDYGIDGVLLSLGCQESSVQIMKYLCETFGGYLDENDCDSEDFYPINIEEFEKVKEITDVELFKNKLIAKFGYDKLNSAMELFSELQNKNNELLAACIWAKDAFRKLANEGKYPEFLLAENGGEGMAPLTNAINNATKK